MARSRTPRTGEKTETTVAATAALPLRLASVNFRTFEIFVSVVDGGGMTATAERFGISQSAVSQVIRAFEEAIGQKLFDRSIRPSVLTLAGRTARHYATGILGGVQALAASIDANGEQRLPQLRVGIANTVAVTIGPQLLDRVRHLAVSWSIASGQSETRIDALMERRVDLIIAFEDAQLPSEFVALPVLAEPHFIAVPASYKGDASSLEAIAEKLDLIRYGRRLHLADQTEKYLEKNGITAPQRYRLDSVDAVIAMVAAGLGWALITPLGLLKSSALAGSLRCIALPNGGSERRLVVITRTNERQDIGPLIQQAAIEIIKNVCLPALQALQPELVKLMRLGDASLPIVPSRRAWK